jgi:hypothetical protein
MGTLRTCAFLAVALLVACDSDGKKNVDAMIIVPDSPPDSPSIDAPPDGPIGGTVQEVVVVNNQPSIQPAQNAVVDICRGNCIGMMNLDTQGPTPASGDFMSMALNTGGMPFNVYVQATKAGNRTSLVFPPSPLTTSVTGIPVLTFTNSAFNLLALLGIMQDPMKGNVVLAVTDCSSMPIGDTGNLMVTVKQGGSDVMGTDVLDAGTLDPALAGTFFIFNVPAGTTELGAVYNGMTLRAHDVRVAAATTTATLVRPGF